MAITGWKTPGTAANVDRDAKPLWGSENEAKVSDNYSAYVVLTKDYSDW